MIRYEPRKVAVSPTGYKKRTIKEQTNRKPEFSPWTKENKDSSRENEHKILASQKNFIDLSIKLKYYCFTLSTRKMKISIARQRTISEIAETIVEVLN